MSNPLPKHDEDGRWSDPHAVRAEFQRRLAQRGIFIRLPEPGREWLPPVPFPVSADEASAMVIRMRRED
ncbi:MAG TPA: hypothetical protein VGC13_28880 [Longimicrobium sp.]|uniref:hypothetical protein n=1 Tax=Longimicrobium sp. TaxID=2029185 RepID=UPI002ED9D4F9